MTLQQAKTGKHGCDKSSQRTNSYEIACDRHIKTICKNSNAKYGLKINERKELQK